MLDNVKILYAKNRRLNLLFSSLAVLGAMLIIELAILELAWPYLSSRVPLPYVLGADLAAALAVAAFGPLRRDLRGGRGILVLANLAVAFGLALLG
jgi:hypothetical protein